MSRGAESAALQSFPLGILWYPPDWKTNVAFLTRKHFNWPSCLQKYTFCHSVGFSQCHVFLRGIFGSNRFVGTHLDCGRLRSQLQLLCQNPRQSEIALGMASRKLLMETAKFARGNCPAKGNAPQGFLKGVYCQTLVGGVYVYSRFSIFKRHMKCK